MLIAALFCLLQSCKKTSTEIQENDDALNDENLAAASNAPNIVIFIGDDIGYEIPTVNGGQSYITPNIDALAQSGLRFTQCYASANCSPSRTMLLTGKYNFRNYVDWGTLPKTNLTIGNLIKNAGYNTCYVGKWQLDGGDTSIRTFGFDKYSVWLPYKLDPEESGGSRYKDPPIYQKAKFLPSSGTQGKYSVDMFTSFALNFIKNNKRKPFFLYYAMPLCHKPLTPTPDDPLFAAWDFTNGGYTFFPEMVTYMDKQVKILRDSIRAAGQENNTIFVFVGDNGTPKGVKSYFKDSLISADKGETTTYGTHVPLIISWPGHITAGRVTNQLVDFTDFLPTLSDIASTTVSSSYGIIDGKSFYSVLNGSNYSTRDYVFNQFQPFPITSTAPAVRYAQDSVYKQYDGGSFYNIVTDVHELKPIPTNKMTPAEKAKQTYFLQIISQMHN